MNIITILSLLLRTLPFLAVTLLSSLINLKKPRRARQFLMPPIAIALCIPCMIFIEKLANVFVKFIYWLVGLLQRIPLIGSGLSSALRILYNTLIGGYGVQLLCNTALMALFCIVKLLVLPCLNRVWTEKKPIYAKTSGIFYRNSDEKNKLYQKFDDLRRMFRVCYVAAVVLGVVDCVMVLLNNAGAIFQVPFYPVFGIIIIGEIFFFLDGSVSDGADDSDEPETPKQDVPCNEILDALKEAFPDRLGYSDQIMPPYHGSHQAKWEEELENGDALSQVTATYFAALQNDLHEVNPDYVSAAGKLMHHKSVLIYNPFYRDMTDYVLLPIFHELLNHHSCLVICGRTANEADIEEWLRDGMNDVTSLPKLWSIGALTSTADTNNLPDIGILGFGKMFDLPTIQSNLQFFQKTTLVILLEPSNILGTGQIGLRSLLQLCENGEEKPTYLVLDRNADGLVDALSHAIRVPLTEVMASPTPQASYCRALWRAEGAGAQTRIFPNISHYMGIGGELSACALRAGASVMHWYSGSKMPLLDLRWNIGQYYSVICQYIDAPREQVELDKRMHFHESLWQANYGPKTFVLAEDEFCNAFEMERAFGARVRGRGIVNILSESYMLREYMYANDTLFSNDPKAIPSIVPDYARTERNFVLRTLLLMSVAPLRENMLSQELILHGFTGKNPYKEFVDLVKKHTDVQDPRIQTVKELVRVGVSSCAKFSYMADKEFIDQVFDSALRSAFYIVEDEQTETYMMGNRLMDHIEQTMLPGQFFSYDGRYYQVKSISPRNGVIVRRAADHIRSRMYYRQCKAYTLKDMVPAEEMKTVRGSKLQKFRGNIAVQTDGYLEMTIRNDLAEADYVELEEPRKRRIVRKEVLMVTLKDTTAEMRFVLCLLFNELFQTIYPSEKDYLFAVMPDVPSSILEEPGYAKKIRSLVPECRMEGVAENSIYFIEDSNIDLGLLVSLERNFQRLMETLTDYLDWYLDPDRARVGEEDKKSEDKDENDDRSEDADQDDASDDTDEESDASEEEGKDEDASDDADDEDDNSDDVDGEDEELYEGYHKGSKLKRFEYLTFGYDPKPDWLHLEETLEYLTGERYLDSNLHRSRRKVSAFDDGSDYDPTVPGVHYCDFCYKPMKPRSYVVLKDGRERCSECSETAIRTRKQFKAVYKETLEEMERIFGIHFDAPIKVRMTNARKVNEGMVDYKPTPQPDYRVLGRAQGNSILVENGAPLWNMKSTLVHELTHIWQHNNWNNDYRANYKTNDYPTQVIEGMAVWVEVQYLLSIGQKERAIAYKRAREHDKSAYGVGMKAYIKKYPPKQKSRISPKHSPFGKDPPL